MPPEIEHAPDIDIQIPNEFDDLKNQKYFSETYKDIVSRYGNNFDEYEIKTINAVRKDGIKEYKGEITERRARVLGNRVDKGIFEHRYEEFEGIDRNIIRTISNADAQRQFREVAIKLKNRLSNLSEDEVKIIGKDFSYAKNQNGVPNFDKTFNKIQKLRKYQQLEDAEINQEIKELNNRTSLNDLFQEIEQDNPELFTNNQNFKRQNQQDGLISQKGLVEKTGKNSQKIEDIQLPTYLEDVKDEINNEEIKRNILHFAKFMKKLDKYETSEETDKINAELIKQGFKDVHKLDKQALQNLESDIFKNISTASRGVALGETIKDVAIRADKEIDVEGLKDVDVDNAIEKRVETDETFLEQEQFLKEYGLVNGNDYKKLRVLHLKLTKKFERDGELPEKEQELLDELNIIFGENGENVSEFITLYKLKRIEKGDDKEESYGRILYKTHIEKIEGDMKSINPDAIVTHNNDIRNYVFKDNSNEYYADFDENISLEHRKTLYQKLMKQHEGDQAFKESIKYLDAYGNINKEKVQEDHIDEESIKRNRETINNMINDLAQKEFHDKEKINKINSVCVRKSIMSTCFRALSKYFDKANNNGENFADEFEISDINENIGFDEETGIIKMTGTIKGNNHIGLYYDTKKGELSFDNFIGYNSNEGYILGKNSGEKEKINIKLPTMDEMERQTDKVNKDLIYNLSFTTPQYIRVLSKVLKESLWIGCFQGFIGTEMDVNRQMVQEFNEKNILKQDIFRSIYSKYYDDDSLNKISNDRLVISEGNSKEQFKLIKLISHSINMCKGSELLRFRNLINKFDKILEENPKLVKKDKLLSVLFGDNKIDKNDIYDNSKKTIQQENPNLPSTQKENNIKYLGNKRYYSNSSSLNYFTFLDLLSDNGVIDLNAFDMVLNTIEKEGVQLLDKKEGLLWTNYLLKVATGELPEINTSKPGTQELITDNTDNIEQEFERKIQDAYEKKIYYK